jgi:PAS domain S-box-containing protein
MLDFLREKINSVASIFSKRAEEKLPEATPETPAAEPQKQSMPEIHEAAAAHDRKQKMAPGLGIVEGLKGRITGKVTLDSRYVDEAMDGVQITDLDGYIVYSNKAMEEIYGFSLNDFHGRHVSELNADKEFAGKVIIPSIKETGRWNGELMVLHKDGRELPIWLSASIVKDSRGEPIAMVGIVRDMTARKSAEEWKENLIHKLNDAFAKIKTLRGLLPICAWCKKIRDDRGYWQKVETYIKEHSDASFTHCICPECLKQVSPETYDEVLRERSDLLRGSDPDKG